MDPTLKGILIGVLLVLGLVVGANLVTAASGGMGGSWASMMGGGMMSSGMMGSGMTGSSDMAAHHAQCQAMMQQYQGNRTAGG